MTEDYHRCVEFLQAKAPELKVFEHEPGEVIVNCYVLQDYIIKLLKVQDIAATVERKPYKHMTDEEFEQLLTNLKAERKRLT